MASTTALPEKLAAAGNIVEDTERRAKLTFSCARILLVASLLAAPFAFGAVQVWAWTLLSVIACLLLFLWALGSVWQQTVRIVWSPLHFAALAFLLLAAIQLMGRFTMDAEGTRESLLKLGAAIIVLFLATQLWSRPSLDSFFEHSKRWRSLGLAVTVFSFLMALFAMVQGFSSRGLIYWKVKTDGWAFGPYVNHNDYAGLMEMLIPIAIAYVLSRPKNRPGAALLGFGLLFPIASVLLSGSRGGCISLAVELAVIAAAAGWHFAQRERRRYAAAGLLGLLSVGALLAWLGTANLAKRWESLDGLARSPEVTLGDRLLVAHDSLHMFHDHAWIGTGLGSFAVVFPQYQSFPTDIVYQHAHNDYLEALTETGVAGGLLMLLAAVVFFRQAFSSLRARLEHASGWIQFGAAIGCCGLLIHSLADFNLHIPANGLWFAFLVGISQSGRSSEAYRQAVEKPRAAGEAT